MHVMILGAAGMVGRKLVERIAREPDALGTTISRLTLVDAFQPPVPEALRSLSNAMTFDLAQAGVADKLIETRPDLIFHLAAIVSGEAEADFDKGYAVNLDGTRALFDAIRQEGLKSDYMPRVVFASSIAVFGTPFPDVIPDEFFSTPLTSYGTQKAIAELLLAEESNNKLTDTATFKQKLTVYPDLQEGRHVRAVAAHRTSRGELT